MIVYGLKARFAEQKGNIRDLRPVWMLEEIGVPYELKLMNPHTMEHKSDDFLRINPFGKVPALRDGDFTLFESAAICTYIGDKNKRLIPIHATHERATYDQWISVVLSSIEPHTGRIYACDFFYEKNEKTTHLKNFAEKMLAGFLPVIEKHLDKNQFILGNEFSAADIAMTGALNFIGHTNLLSAYSQISRFQTENHQRLAYKKALNLNGQLEVTND